jgi:hypothetical protein
LQSTDTFLDTRWTQSTMFFGLDLHAIAGPDAAEPCGDATCTQCMTAPELQQQQQQQQTGCASAIASRQQHTASTTGTHTNTLLTAAHNSSNRKKQRATCLPAPIRVTSGSSSAVAPGCSAQLPCCCCCCCCRMCTGSCTGCASAIASRQQPPSAGASTASTKASSRCIASAAVAITHTAAVKQVYLQGGNSAIER